MAATVLGMERDPERLGRRTRSLLLIDQAFQAYDAGDEAENQRLLAEAIEVDPEGAIVVLMGIQTGKLPNPDTQPQAWTAWVKRMRDRPE